MSFRGVNSEKKSELDKLEDSGHCTSTTVPPSGHKETWSCLCQE